MKCYAISGRGYIRYAGSQLDAREARKQLVEISGCKKSDFEITPVDVPTDKERLLTFLNNAAEYFDGVI